MKDISTAEELLAAARDYAALAMEHLVEYVHVDEDDFDRLDIELQTVFLFPTLTDAERTMLTRLRELGRWLAATEAADGFGLTDARRLDLQRKIESVRQERKSLEERVRLNTFPGLTEAQRAVFDTIYRLENDGFSGA